MTPGQDWSPAQLSSCSNPRCRHAFAHDGPCHTEAMGHERCNPEHCELAPRKPAPPSTTYGQKCSRCESWVVVVTEVRPQRLDQGLTVLCPVCICWPPAPGELLPQLHLEHGGQGLVDVMATLALEQLADG